MSSAQREDQKPTIFARFFEVRVAALPSHGACVLLLLPDATRGVFDLLSSPGLVVACCSFRWGYEGFQVNGNSTVEIPL